jgi:hypothetical protein
MERRQREWLKLKKSRRLGELFGKNEMFEGDRETSFGM